MTNIESKELWDKIDLLEKVVTGNGDPERGMIVSFARMDQKQDAIMDKLDSHLGNKEIHRTELESQNKMIKVAKWIVPIFIGVSFVIHFTLSGDWTKIGELFTKWLGG